MVGQFDRSRFKIFTSGLIYDAVSFEKQAQPSSN
jgi:hypothetical protein